MATGIVNSAAKKMAPTVAVIGAGPAGLSMLKTLREDGFAVTGFERRSRVGGLWAYSDNPSYTTALPRTRANISKFTCGYSDYPMPDKFPPHMSPSQFQEFMEGYCTHFDLHRDIVFNATVKRAERSADDARWRLELEIGRGDGEAPATETREFDKIVFCHGYQTIAHVPAFEGQEAFEGVIMHSQQYRSPEPFKGKNVIVVGLTSTSGDVVPDLVPHAAKVYVSHRRGALPFKRYRNGVPVDLGVTWRRRQVVQLLQRYVPGLARRLGDLAVGMVARRACGPFDPAWGLEPFPSISLVLPGSWEDVLPLLREGRVESLPGVRRFAGPRAVELADGRVLEDIDAVVLCTGYRADFGPAPFVETSRPRAHGYAGEPVARLYMNLFPPAYADSCAMLCYSAFGKSNGFSFADVTSMAVSNVWRGVEPLPPRAEMERAVDEHQAFVAGQWALDPTVDVSCVRQWEFQGWLHRAAGTGMESLGWGWRGWLFWLRDRRLYNLMNHGVETAHAYRFFETGRRRVWPGARAEIIRQNELVRELFPIKDEAEQRKLMMA